MTDIGCSDIGCLFRDNKVGTNGGCSCLKGRLTTGVRIAVEKTLRENQRLKVQLKKETARAEQWVSECRALALLCGMPEDENRTTRYIGYIKKGSWQEEIAAKTLANPMV